MDITPSRPINEGYGPSDRPAGDLAMHVARVSSSSATLADLAADYAMFNHGALFVHGRLDVDPVADFVASHPDRDCKAIPATFRHRVAHGLSVPGRPVGPPFEWDRTLFFVESRFWPDLRAHLLRCAWVDRRRGRYGRAVLQELPVVDFLALARLSVAPAPLPTVPVAFFGVDGTHAHVQFVARAAFHDDVAVAVHLPPVAETVALGAAMLSGDPRPFRSIDTEGSHAGQQGRVPPPA
jgi:hypothetical protein